MAVARPILAVVSLILVMGAALLIFLTLLGGAANHNPTNRFYFLQADTSGIANAATVTRWTFWNACSVINGRSSCPKVHAAYPLDPPRNFGTTANVPPQFIGTHHYYYLTRFMFAFVLMSLFFTLVTIFLGVLALCSRIGSFLSSAVCSVALFFQTLATAIMTAVFVQGRNIFHTNGRSANLGKYNFGFMWASVAALFIATVLLFSGGAASRSHQGGGGGRVGGGRRGGRIFGGRSFGGRFPGLRGRGKGKERGSFIDRSSFEKERPLGNGV